MSELLEIADRVIAMVQPGEQVEAYVARGSETDVRVYQGEVEHFVSAQSEGIGIRIIRDGKTGFAYASTLDPTAIGEVLADARDNVQFGNPDEWAGLAEPDGVDITEVDLWSEVLESFPTERKIELATELEKLTLASDSRVRSESSNYSDGAVEAAVASTNGIRHVGKKNGCYLYIGTLADDGDESQTGFGFTVGRSPEEFDLSRAASDAAMRATRLIGATKPPSRRTNIVLSPYATAMLLGIIGSTLNGESVTKGRSLFAERLGEMVANPIVSLVDDPTNPLAYTATDLDGEGLAARRNVLIEAGKLNKFVHNSYSARRAKTVSTGNATRGGFAGVPGVGCMALQLQPGTRDQAALIGGIDDGILIDTFFGLHSGVNPISGDFSAGASGLSISGGALGAPVREFTVGSTLQRMLLDVIEVGSDVDWLPMSAAGVSLAIADVTISGE